MIDNRDGALRYGRRSGPPRYLRQSSFIGPFLTDARWPGKSRKVDLRYTGGATSTGRVTIMNSDQRSCPRRLAQAVDACISDVSEVQSSAEMGLPRRSWPNRLDALLFRSIEQRQGCPDHHRSGSEYGAQVRHRQSEETPRRQTQELLGVAKEVRDVGGRSQAADVKLVALDPERLRFGFKVSDIPTSDDLKAIRSLHAAGKLSMIGEVDYQYEGIRHDDPRLEPLWTLAEELQVPIAVHPGAGPAGIIYHGSPHHRERIGDPASFEDVLVRHPRVKLIVMHAGFPFFDDMLALMQAYPQVHVDVGALDWADPAPGFHDYLRRLVTYGYRRRILFGSDQMVWPEGTALAITRIRQVTYLSADERRDILFNNAMRLFGWTDLAGCGSPA